MQGKLDTVKGVMVQNIEMILERGEKLELLVDKTDQLQTQVAPARPPPPSSQAARTDSSSKRACLVPA